MNYKNIIVFFIAIFPLTSTNLSAQDLIVKSNGEQIKCKVEELTDTTIKYRKFKKPNGPLYNINKTEVVTVNFEDGTIEVIPQTKARPTFSPIGNTEERAKSFQFYDQTISVSYVSYDDFKGFSLEYEEEIGDDMALKIPLYIVFENGQNIMSTGLNLKYYFYRDTWVNVFAGPEVNVGYLQNDFLKEADLDIVNLQILADFGLSFTPVDNIRITPHIGLGYGDAFVINNSNNYSIRLDNGFTFNFNIGVGYSF